MPIRTEMSERTKEIQVTGETRDFLKNEKGTLSYNEFLYEVFFYMKETRKCYNDFLKQLEKKKKEKSPKLPKVRRTTSYAKEKGVR